jgi:hypothetical protein
MTFGAVGATVDIAERHQKPINFIINAATALAVSVQLKPSSRQRCTDLE